MRSLLGMMGNKQTDVNKVKVFHVFSDRTVTKIMLI